MVCLSIIIFTLILTITYIIVKNISNRSFIFLDFPLYLGNPVTVTNLHQQVAARATYIYTSRPLASAAVITTILAYVASSEPVYVQIWRPRSQGSTHTLVGQYLLQYDDAPAMLQVGLCGSR